MLLEAFLLLLLTVVGSVFALPINGTVAIAFSPTPTITGGKGSILRDRDTDPIGDCISYKTSTTVGSPVLCQCYNGNNEDKGMAYDRATLVEAIGYACQYLSTLVYSSVQVQWGAFTFCELIQTIADSYDANKRV